MTEASSDAQQQRPSTVDNAVVTGRGGTGEAAGHAASHHNTNANSAAQKKEFNGTGRSKDGTAAGSARGQKDWDSSNQVHVTKPLPQPNAKKQKAAVPTPVLQGSSSKQRSQPSSSGLSQQLAEAKLLAQKWMQQRDAVESGKAKELTFDTDSPIDFVLPSCQGSLFEGPQGYPVPARHMQLTMQKSPRSLSPRLNSRCGTRNSSRGPPATSGNPAQKKPETKTSVAPIKAESDEGRSNNAEGGAEAGE
jgi:hypothetical protein